MGRTSEDDRRKFATFRNYVANARSQGIDVVPKIAAVTCLHTSAQLTAMPGRRLHLDKSASAPLRVEENSEVGPWAANTATQHFEHDPDTCRSRPHQEEESVLPPLFGLPPLNWSDPGDPAVQGFKRQMQKRRGIFTTAMDSDPGTWISSFLPP